MENIFIEAWKHFDMAGKLITICLLLLSLYSWKVIFEKFFFLREVEKRNRLFEQLIRKGKNPQTLSSPLNAILNYGIEIRDKTDNESLDIHLEKAFLREEGKLEAKLTSLATITTISPFLGLLGTVWGLLLSFQEIVTAGSSSASVVADGISIALMTTVVGLIVAIPAAIGYNYYRERVANILEKMALLFPFMLEYLKSYSDRED